MYWIYNNKNKFLNIQENDNINNNRGLQWNKNDEDKLLKLYNNDKKSINEISEIFKRTNVAIRYRLSKLGITINE